MIPYDKNFLGLNLIFRVHGSPIYRAAIPGIISTLIFLCIEIYISVQDEDKVLSHPYGVGVLISSVSFLIVFRANYGYQRYWNACGDVHQMMSKWLDAITHTGVYHMQQEHHNHIKPPSYFENHDLNRLGLKRDRERERDVSNLGRKGKRERAVEKSINSVRKSLYNKDEQLSTTDVAYDTTHLMDEGRKDGGWGLMFEDEKSTFYSVDKPNTWNDDEGRGFASTAGGRTPSLFLQELVHLASLCNAVAFSTLRNDVEGAESPLDLYTPGSPWPNVDSDREKDKSALELASDTMQYLFGFDKSPAARTEHNASRPLHVLGGVSDNEIAFLQKARGPSAKVTLAWHWLSEFIIREHLAGSLGKVGPPIISRIFQFLSDGMIFYNHARKTMFIPFPFPHAQISAFFVFTIMFAVPLLMDEYSNNIYLGALLTFLTVTCLAGLHEVARELENPFRNVPNEIPLCTLQAMFNESLITLFSGYHPDHYWEPNDYQYQQAISTSPTSESTLDSIDMPQAPKKDSKLNGPATLGQLRAVVARQEKEISRLSTLIETSGKERCDTL
jgi:predicted membrane chloride channel (bestrophin family)